MIDASFHIFKPGDITSFGTFRAQYGAILYFGSGQYHDGQELCNTVSVWETKVLENLKKKTT